jgi:hypothetical protein
MILHPVIMMQETSSSKPHLQATDAVAPFSLESKNGALRPIKG